MATNGPISANNREVEPLKGASHHDYRSFARSCGAPAASRSEASRVQADQNPFVIIICNRTNPDMK
jgi:hypothetical protein